MAWTDALIGAGGYCGCDGGGGVPVDGRFFAPRVWAPIFSVCCPLPPPRLNEQDFWGLTASCPCICLSAEQLVKVLAARDPKLHSTQWVGPIGACSHRFLKIKVPPTPRPAVHPCPPSCPGPELSPEPSIAVAAPRPPKLHPSKCSGPRLPYAALTQTHAPSEPGRPPARRPPRFQAPTGARILRYSGPSGPPRSPRYSPPSEPRGLPKSAKSKHTAHLLGFPRSQTPPWQALRPRLGHDIGPIPSPDRGSRERRLADGE